MTTDQPDPAMLSDPERLAVLEATGLLDSEPEESFDRYTRLAARTLDADAALLALVTPERQFFKSSVGLSSRLSELQETPLTLSLCKHTVARRSTVVLEDLEREPLPEASGVIEELGFRSYAGAPLTVEDDICLGSLSVLDAGPRAWSEREIAQLVDLAAAASTEIALRLDVTARERVERGQERRIRQQEAIAELGTRALQSGNPIELMSQLVDRVARGLGVDFAKVLLLEPGGDRLRVVSGVGWREGYVGNTLVAVDEETQAGTTLLTGGPVIVESGLETDERFEGGRILHEHGIESGITVPIPGSGEEDPLGVLGAHSNERRAFTREDVHFVRSAANVLAEHLHRDRQRRELHRRHHRFRRLLANAPIPLAVYDESGVLHANRAAAELVDVDGPDDLVGRSVLEFVHPDGREEARKRVERVLVEREPTGDDHLRLVRPDGEVREVAVRSIPVEYRGRQAVQATLRDVTEERTAKRELERSEARFRAVAESANDALLTIDADSRIVYANPAAHEIFGYPAGELPGRSLLDLIPEDLRDVHQSALREYIETDERHLDWSGTELPAVRSDGRRFTVEVSFGEYRIEGERRFTGIVRDITERKEAQRALRRSEQRYRLLFEKNVAGVARATLDGEILEANPAAARIFGYDSPDEMVGLPAREVYGRPGEREAVVRELEDTGRLVNKEFLGRRADGSDVHLLVSSTLIRDPATEQKEIVATLIDVTERRRAEQALRESEERYRRLFEDSKDVIYITDRDGKIFDVNPAGEDLFGYPREELLSMDATRLYHNERDRERFRQEIREKGYIDDFEVQLETVGGEVRDCLITATVRTDGEGGIAGYQGIIRDVTEQKAFEQELERRALHDPLTDLPNRVLFWDRLEQAVARLERTGGRIAVIFLDLDGFKAVNDSLGHAAGDQVLRETARRLESAVREPDTVSRMGGDEFTVLLEDLEGPAAAERVASRLTESFSTPFRAAGEKIHLDASLGVAHLAAREGEEPEPAFEEPEELVQRADAAMFRAKKRGTTRWVAYDPDRDVADTTRIQRENELRRALDRKELLLHYQPIVDLETGACRGVEPLVRWDHPERGLLPPGEFLDLAEESGLILPMGRWILREACEQVADWNRRLDRDRRLSLHPNLSASQFEDPELAGFIMELVEDFDLDPAELMLEVTEHLVMRAPERTRQLARRGIRLAIDDFGTGYSSLSHVRELEVHALKIDRSFLEGLGDDRRDDAIVTTILTLGETLNLEVVAEGIETEDQLRWLREAGCSAGQGFLFARPGPPDEMEEVLTGGRVFVPDGDAGG